jgi:hypothetical protein
MATFRVGIGSFIITEDKGVGFGTSPTDGLGNLKVKGVTKTTGSIVSGASTLTRYSGFAADNINQLENITLTSEVGTIGDIVVGVGTSVIISSGSTVTVGTVESVSIGTHFSPPTGGIEERGENFIEGMMRFNTDLNTMEFYNGNEWRQFTYITDIQNSPSGSGRIIYAGGNNTGSDPYTINDIVFLQATTKGNVLDFGFLTQATRNKGAGSNGTRGLFAAGASPNNTTNTNVIEYITIQSKGNSIDFGDTTLARRNVAGTSSSTRMLIAAGYSGSSPTPSATDIVDYVEMSTLGNALDFGDLTLGDNNNQYAGGTMSPVRSVYFGASSPFEFLSYFTIASKGNSTHFGVLSSGGGTFQGTQPSSNTRGVLAGMVQPQRLDNIEFITIASEGNSTHFGELTVGRNGTGSGGGGTRGLWAGGTIDTSSTYSNIIDFITISTTGNAEDFGDIPSKSSGYAGCSDIDGGLGGY